MKKIYKCKCIKENGIPCGNPLYAVVNGKIFVKRHGREVVFDEKQSAQIKCERCGGVTKVGENE